MVKIMPHLSAYCCILFQPLLAYVNKASVLVAWEGYQAINIPASRKARRPEGKIRKYVRGEAY
jgi:hypothetical protein